MGKKHKKHHKHDYTDTEVGEKPLKLVLRVGGNADGGFTSKAVVMPSANSSVPISVTTATIQRETAAAFRGEQFYEDFVPQSTMSSSSVLAGEDDVVKKKKKKKKKHRHLDEGVTPMHMHQTVIPSYRPEEQERLARLYHHPSVSEVHRPMGNVQPSPGDHRHHHKHKKHHHHHYDRPDKKHRLVAPVVSAAVSEGDPYGDGYVTPMVSTGEGLKMSFKREPSFMKSFEPPAKKALMSFPSPIPPGFFIDPTIPARVTRSQDVPGFDERNRLDRIKDKELKKLLRHYLNALQRKDTHQFFAMPVSDKIAPGYSTVIKHPMDFQTIKLKIDRSEYRSVDQFKDDLELICTNCTTYNAPDTIYYKAAVKLLDHGIRLMKDSLSPSNRNMPAHLSTMSLMMQNSVAGPAGVARSADEDLIDVDNVDDDIGASLLSERNRRYGVVDIVNSSSPDQDSMSEQVTEQVVKAAKAVADKIEEQCPNSKIGFLSSDANGATSLRVLNPDTAKENVPVDVDLSSLRILNRDTDKENVPVDVDLRSLAGPVRNGTSKLADVKEDAKDLVIPVSYLFYGPFTSFAPSYDSSRANLTKEESDLLLSSYTDATGVQLSHSLQKFVETAGPAARRVVDSILDSATNGKHSLLRAKQQEHQKAEDDKQKDQQQFQTDKSDKISKATEALPKSKDFESLLSLAAEGIDISFLDDNTYEMGIQSRLDENAHRLMDLQEAQNQRLAKVYDSLESLSSQLTGPSDQETHLALKVAQELKELSQQVRPGDVVPVEEIQHLLRQGMAASKIDNEATNSSDTNGGTSLLQELGLDDNPAKSDNDGVIQSDDFVHVQQASAVLQQDASEERELTGNAGDYAKELDNNEDFSIATLLDKFTGDSTDL